MFVIAVRVCVTNNQNRFEIIFEIVIGKHSNKFGYELFQIEFLSIVVFDDLRRLPFSP